MGKLLTRFKGYVGREVLDSIHGLAGLLSGRSVLHVHTGRLRRDAVAMLGRLGSYFEDVGVQFRETTIVGTEELFDVVRLTEGVSAGSGMSQTLSTTYGKAMRENAQRTFLSSDLVIVHGLQPLGLIEHRDDDCPWLWRCHANLTGAGASLLAFVRRYIQRYQGALFSHTGFAPQLGVPVFVIPPSIDPFSPVNQELSATEVGRTLSHLGIPTERPLALHFLTSSFAGDALEAIRVLKSGYIPDNAVLVLVRIGEGRECVRDSELEALRALDPRVRVLHFQGDATRELCALGWAAQVVVDPSSSHWPNLDLMDVMWKGTAALVSSESATAPFISSEAGYCVRTREELSRKLGELLENARTAKDMGAYAHLAIARQHLVPRHLLDYLKLMLYFIEGESGG